MSETFAILLAGELKPTERLRRQLAGARVIAADAGLKHATALGVAPELVVGDFDSLPEDVRAAFAHVPLEEHPPAKDFTDGALAVERALERGARRLLLLGAFGGRSDHAVMHLLQLADLARRGVAALASSGVEEAHGLAPGDHVIDLPVGTPFSLLAFSDMADVHLSGARWPLRGERLAVGETRPMSNVAEGPLHLRIGSGLGVLLARPGERS